MSVDKVLALAQSIVMIQLTLPQNKQTNHITDHAHETSSTHRTSFLR